MSISSSSDGAERDRIGRRGFLTAGAGAFLCTIGGERVLVAKPGDARKADAEIGRAHV